MRHPLTLRTMLERARRYYPNREVVSRTATGIFRYTYKEYYERTRRLAAALSQLGVKKGTRVGTLAWNTHRHLRRTSPCLAWAPPSTPSTSGCPPTIWST